MSRLGSVAGAPRAVGAAARRHPWFAVAFGLGVVVRLMTFTAFHNGLMTSDAHVYLVIAAGLHPVEERVVGYPIFLVPFVLAHVPTWYVAGLQHLLGLGVATLGYALLRRWRVGPVAATLAVLPVLLDAMQLMLEQAVLSDVLFQVVLLGAIAALAWRPEPSNKAALWGGLLLGLSVLVRISGEPVILGGLAFCLLAGRTWRRRVVSSVLLVAAFVVPLVPYAFWYQAQNGPFALQSSSGRSLFMRTTAFVDCSKFRVPSYEKVLCPQEPLGHREEPTVYGWFRPDRFAGLEPPKGVTVDQAFRDFAVRAIRAQPGDYVRTVVRDSWLPFDLTRGDRYEYDTSEKWLFSTWATHRVNPRSPLDTYAEYGGPYRTWQPMADTMAAYGKVVYLWGPLFGVLLVLAVAGLVWPRRPRGTRPLLFLTLSLGVGLTLLPIVTTEFVWRYLLPALLLVPMAAALGWARLRSGPLPRAAAPEAP